MRSAVTRGGRSLFELLVCIGIIALMLGLLAPVAFMVLRMAQKLGE
jgi:hypothetical protein